MTKIQEINNRFYNKYPFESLKSKFDWLKNLFLIKTTSSTYEKDITKIFPLVNIPEFNKYLVQELHFLQFHIIEAFFSLLFALQKRDEENLWIRLSFTDDPNARSFKIYDNIAKMKDIYAVTQLLRLQGNNDQKIEYWKFLFYKNFDFTATVNQNDLYQETVNLISRFAKIFTSRELYSAYKHGLRLFDSGSISINVAPESSPGVTSGPFATMATASQSFTHLTTKNDNNDMIVNLTSTAISTNHDIYNINICLKMIENIIKSRRSITKGFIPNIFSSKQQPALQGNLIASSRSITRESTILNNIDSLFNSKDYKNVNLQSEILLKINPKSYWGRVYKGISNYNLKNYLEAKGDLEIAIRKSRNRINSSWVDFIYILANCEYMLKNEEEGIKLLVDFIEKYDNKVNKKDYYTAALTTLTKYFFKQNSILLKSTNRNKKSYLLKSLMYLKLLDPKFTDLSSYFAILEQLTKVKKSKTLSTFEEMIIERPNEFNVSYNYAKTLYYLNENQKAIDFIDGLNKSGYTKDEIKNIQKIKEDLSD